MRASYISYSFLLTFLATTFALQWWQQVAYRYDILFVIGLLLLFSAIVTRSKRSLYLLAVLLGCSTAFFCIARTTHSTTALHIDAYANNIWTEVRGHIAAEPDRRPMQTKYTITAEELQQGDTVITPVRGKILATDRRAWPEFQYGDEVVVRGVLEKPGQIETFHYDRYLSRYGIYSVMYNANVGTLERVSKKTSNVLAKLFQTKQTFESQINKLYPEPHASFMAGLLTGSRKGIPEKLMADFNTTGLTHIIAISGYNITIIISIITGMLFWLPLKWRFVPAVTAIIAFTIFVGASAAVVRAAIMGILGLLALQLNRLSHVRLSVLWTAFFMLAWNPKYLWYDAGFQLSFLAVLGLMELAPYLDRWFARIPQTLGMREALQMTCAAQLAAVPLIIFLFGRFSLIAPIANVLVAPFIPLAMLFGFLGTIVSFVFFPLGQLIAYLGWACLEWIVTIAHWTAAIPYASIDLKIATWSIGGYYLAMVGLVIWREKNGIRNLELGFRHTLVSVTSK